MVLGNGVVRKVLADGKEDSDVIKNVTGFEFGSVNSRFTGVLVVMTETSSHYYAPGRWVELDLFEPKEETATDG